MDEQRVQAYVELIQELLSCPNGQAPELLQRNQNLVDIGLVLVMGQVVEILQQQGQEVNAKWLNNIASQLAQYLDDQSSPVTGEGLGEIEFLLQILTTVKQNPDPQVLYSLLQANLDKVNLELAQTLQNWAVQTLPQLNLDEQRSMAGTIGVFSNLIQNFPFNRAESIEIAIVGYEVIGQVFTRESLPQAWSAIMNDLANIYSDRIIGNQEENIEQAISLYEQVFTVRTQSAMPVEWAETMMNLATAYFDRVRGNRGENIEQAIAATQQALTVRTQSARPVEWATTISNLAYIYCWRTQGDREENIEQAIAFYEQALTVRTQSAMPVEWAQTMMNLAIAYYFRIRGNRGENIEQAIAFYEQALTVITQTSMPLEWARIMTNLGAAYRHRIRGDRAENLEQAIAFYEQALTVRTQSAMPLEWAQTMMNLAIAYAKRIRGDRAENLEQAIAANQQALTVMTQLARPLEWAKTMWNLASAYFDRQRGNPAENIEQAIDFYEQALTVMTQTSMPVEWANATMGLANAYSDRRRGNSAENIEQAIAFYEQALTVMTQTSMPVEWARTMLNLAIAYPKRIQGQKVENIEQAISHYQQALTVFQPDTFPNDCRLTARPLANLYANDRRWREATEPYTLAITAAENLYAASLFRSSQEAELQETNDLYRRAAYTYAQTGDLPKAITTLEQGRARGLSETLQRDRADLEQVKQTNRELYERYQAAAKALSQIESSERTLSADPNRPQLTPEDLRQQATRIRNDLQACLNEIRQIPGYENFLALPTFEEIVKSVRPNNPLVYLLVTPSGSLALVLQLETPEASHTIQSIWLDLLAQENLIQHLQTWFAADRQNKTAYSEYARNRSPQTEQAFIQAQQDWHQTIDRTTEQLWTPVMEPIVNYLQQRNFTQATLIPTGYLSFLPLHAAWTEDPTTPTGRRYALDSICFTYTPNARSLQTAQVIAQQTPVTNLLAIDNPTQDLPSSRLEVAAATASFPHHKIFQHQQATHAAVRDALKTHSVFHFSCHGTANLNEPLNSGLLMADGLLALRDLFDLRLQGIRLALLSACETGIPGLDLPDEVVSLPVGLLQAGVAGVVASLWSVSDLSTMLLLTRFYDFWRKDGLEPTEALRQAQIWVRDTTHREKAKYFRDIDRDLSRELLYQGESNSFAHPFYWSAFTYTGV